MTTTTENNTEQARSGAATGSAAGVRHYKRFTMDCESYVVYRDDCFVKAIGDPESLPWRACVRTGDGTMHWQWCRSEQDALTWIERWNQPNNEDLSCGPQCADAKTPNKQPTQHHV